MNHDIETEVRTLLSLRRRHPEGASHTIPAHLSINDAYHVQAEVLRLLGDEVGGWKVTIGPDGRAAAAPLLASAIIPPGSSLTSSSTTKIETELGFKLKRDLPARQKPYSREDILDAISAVQCAFEIVQSRSGDDIPFPNFLADNLANGCTVLSGKESYLSDDITDIDAVIVRDDVKIATGRHKFGDPILPIMEYANAPCDYLGGLRNGQVVITGSFTGAIPVVAPARYIGSIGTFDPVIVQFT